MREIDRREFVKGVGMAGAAGFRYTADGTLISETRGVGIRVYVDGNWASAGCFGQVTHHDRSNSRG